MGPKQAEEMADAIKKKHAAVYDRDPAGWEETRQHAAQARTPETADFIAKLRSLLAPTKIEDTARITSSVSDTPQSYQEITWTRYDGALAAEEMCPGQKHVVQPEWYHRDHPCFDEYRRPLGDRWEPILGTWYEMAPFGPSPVPADAPFPDDLGLIRDYCAGARLGLSRAALLQFFLVAHKDVFNASSPNPMIRKMERDAHVAILQNPHAFNKEIAPLMKAEAERDPQTSLQVAVTCQRYVTLLDNVLTELLIHQAEQREKAVLIAPGPEKHLAPERPS